MTARVACISMTCCSIVRTPRALVAMTTPIATIETATTASATSTSMMVKPAVPLSVGDIVRNNVDPSSQPVDAKLVADVGPCQRHRAATNPPAGKEADRRYRFTLVAGSRQQCPEVDVIGNADNVRVGARADHAAMRVDEGC